VDDDDSLGELEIACLMRVLSKPEIEHCIVVNELALVLENFGIKSDEMRDPENLQEEVEQKKQKITKKKQIKTAIWDSSSQASEMLY
jgi:hypothetical protein